MRVLYVNHTSRISGGELSLLGLLGALPAEVEAAVACPEGELAERLRAAGVTVLPIRGTDGSLRLHPVRTPLALAEMGAAALGVWRAVGRFEADLLHANSIRAGLISIAPGRVRRRPTLVHVRDCLPPGRASRLVLGALGHADFVVANSRHTRDRLGPSHRAARVVYNGIDLSRFDGDAGAGRARAGLGLDSGPVLAVVAQITPWKGQDDAIRVAAALRDRHPGLRLLLVGAPKFDSAATRHDNRGYLAELKRQTRSLGLADQVLFLGERDDVPDLLAAVDLLLVPSWEEPFGRSVVEAMAAGVPVAGTARGGPAEVVEPGRTGLVLAPRDPEGWAAAVGALLDEPARLAAMGRAAREEARRRFGIDRHAAAITALYREALAAAAPDATG